LTITTEPAATERRFTTVTVEGAGDPAVRARLEATARDWEARQERITRASLRDLAERWPDEPTVVWWLEVRSLTHLSLTPEADHDTTAGVCDKGTHMVCAWLIYRDAVRKLGDFDPAADPEVTREHLEREAEAAENLLVNGATG
jgi:hypothetical protein